MERVAGRPLGRDLECDWTISWNAPWNTSGLRLCIRFEMHPDCILERIWTISWSAHWNTSECIDVVISTEPIRFFAQDNLRRIDYDRK